MGLKYNRIGYIYNKTVYNKGLECCRIEINRI